LTEAVRHEPGPLIEEAASVFFLVGGTAAKHFIIVGGLVPPLLVPDAHDAHLGSADIDFCLVDGTQELEDETAAANLGPELRPFSLRAGRLIDRDAISTTIEGVRLVYRPGARADVAIRYAGPVGFLAAKAVAVAVGLQGA
jgi:hypothetical protein